MTSSLRLLIRDRASDCCEYCLMQATFSHDPFSAEHIIPTAKGGLDDENNLAWSCLGCNFHKFTATQAIDPVTGNLVPLFNPRTDEWKQHFEWINNYSFINGITPIGRATIMRLHLNRIGLVNLRKILVTAQKHPPII